jgi:uncharacterized membrane protein
MAASYERITSCVVTIQRSEEELFPYWEPPILLPAILRHLHGRFEEQEASATPGVGVISFAVVQREPPRLLEWVAQNEQGLLYRAFASFRPAPGDRGTELRFSLELLESSSALRRMLNTLSGREPGALMREDLRNFKQFMEAGEYPTTRGQPCGKRSLKGRALTAAIGERLQRELSFGRAETRPRTLISAESLP